MEPPHLVCSPPPTLSPENAPSPPPPPSYRHTRDHSTRANHQLRIATPPARHPLLAATNRSDAHPRPRCTPIAIHATQHQLCLCVALRESARPSHSGLACVKRHAVVQSACRIAISVDQFTRCTMFATRRHAFCTAYCDAALRIYPVDVERALTCYVSRVDLQATVCMAGVLPGRRVRTPVSACQYCTRL